MGLNVTLIWPARRSNQPPVPSSSSGSAVRASTPQADAAEAKANLHPGNFPSRNRNRKEEEGLGARQRKTLAAAPFDSPPPPSSLARRSSPRRLRLSLSAPRSGKAYRRADRRPPPPAMSSQVPPRSAPPPRAALLDSAGRLGFEQVSRYITPLVAAAGSLLALLDLDSLCCARRSPSESQTSARSNEFVRGFAGRQPQPIRWEARAHRR